MSQEKKFNFDNSADWTFDNTKVVVSSTEAKLLLQNDPNQEFVVDFASDAGFTYDNTKSEFSGGLLQQKPVDITESYLQPFTSATGFTYNSSYAEFASGVARQISQVPAGAVFWATYTSSINLSYETAGNITGTAYNGAAIVGNRLDLTGGIVNKYVQYTTVTELFGNVGHIKFKYTPSYSGTPATSQNMFLCGNGANNKLQIYHKDTQGTINLAISNSVGVSQINASLAVWAPTAGQTYTIELFVDTTTGNTKVLVNGVQQGQTQTNTFTRTNVINYMNIGTNAPTSTAYANFTMEDLIVRNTTPTSMVSYTLPEAKYVETVVTCPASASYAYNISSFGTPTITATNAPKYIVNGYSYFGGSWQASSDTYATAMTLADWQANIATFPSGQLSSAVTVKVVFQNSNTLGSIDDIAFTINEFHYVQSNVVTPELEYAGVGNLIDFESFTAIDTAEPRYSVQIGRTGTYLYFNGSAWTASDGSYAQANSATVFNANVGSLNVLGQRYGQFKIHFIESNTQQSVDNLDIFLTAQTYPVGSFTIESVDNILSDGFLSFSSVQTAPTGSSVRWIIKKKDGNYYYYNGSSFVSSNLSEAQSNTISELSSAAPALVSVGENFEQIHVVALLTSDGDANPSVNSVTSLYSFYSSEPVTNIGTSVIYFYIHDLLNIEFSEATFYVSSKKSFFHTERLIVPHQHSVEANSEGYVEIEVIETTSVNKKLEFKLDYVDPNDNTTKTIKFKSALVPNQTLTKGTEILTVK